MWWFAATLRKGGGEGPNLHLLHSTMSKSPLPTNRTPFHVRGTRRFSNRASYGDASTCGNVDCLTSCHLGFVSDSCHFLNVTESTASLIAGFGCSAATSAHLFRHRDGPSLRHTVFLRRRCQGHRNQPIPVQDAGSARAVLVDQPVTADSRSAKAGLLAYRFLSVRAERFGHTQRIPVGVGLLSGKLEFGTVGPESRCGRITRVNRRPGR